MRVTIKGGVWKNTEDELLKAAVMKYGKSSWARVASLLPRKSAKQCKARWHEWLDPSIKKTEWTREEDEKLLHLVRVLPTQWRTIAPIVGRTAAQCIERYDRLLNMAEGVGDAEAEAAGRLGAGDIDPAPETKPARPDPVDMDEDEKEMLSEARARLANTMGKKAKRKEREKQLQEARRLAMLQKRRELRAAGVNTGRRLLTRRLKKGQMDFNREIPFQKQAPAGFYDVSAESTPDGAKDDSFRAALLSEMEGKSHQKEVDRQRNIERKRLRRLEEMDLPAAIAKSAAVNDPLAVRKRSRLVMPPPQASDSVLAEVARAGASGALGAGSVGGDTPTRELLGATPHTGTPGGATPAPLRTPAPQDTVMEEARYLASMRGLQTPLEGGANPAAAAGGLAGGSSGATPLRTPGATPARGAGGAGATPLHTGATPLRDGLALNERGADGASVAGSSHVLALSSKAERAAKRARAAAVRSDLASLPQPKYAYEVVVPERESAAGAAAAAAAAARERDAAEEAAERAAAAEAEAARARRRRTQAVQRGLPRPAAASGALLALQDGGRAAALVRAEAAALVRADAARFPVEAGAGGRKGKKDKAGRKRTRGVAEDAAAREAELEAALAALEPVDDVYLHRARTMVTAEVEAAGVPAGARDALADGVLDPSMEAVFVPTSGLRLASEVEDVDMLAALKHRHAALRAVMGREGKRAAKLENKLKILTKGYASRAARASEDAEAQAAELASQRAQAACFERLLVQEEAALPRRQARVDAELAEQQERQAALQERYAALAAERAGLQRVLAAAGVAV